MSDGKRRGVGGLADRFCGAIGVFWVSKLIGEEFLIEWDHPDRLRSFYKFREHRTNTPPDDTKGVFDAITLGGHEILRKAISEAKTIDKLRDSLKDLLGGKTVHSNSPLMDIFHNQYLRSELMSRGYPALQHEWVGQGFRHNFSYQHSGAYVSKGISDLELFQSSSSRMTVGIHVRTGGQRADWTDPELDSEELVTTRLHCLLHKGQLDGCQFFIASDSTELKARLSELLHSRGYPCVMNSGTVKHLDRSTSASSHEAVLDFECLRRCDCVLHGSGRYGLLAAITGKGCQLNLQQHFAGKLTDFVSSGQASTALETRSWYRENRSYI